MNPHLVLLAFLLLPALSTAETLTGRVAKIVDGDTVYVLDEAQERHKIRLSGIDTPERKQPFGQKAKEHLSGMIAGEQVRVEWDKRDRYKRIVGKIIQNDRDVNLQMVREGMAWWYRSTPRSSHPRTGCFTKMRRHALGKRAAAFGPTPIRCRRGNGGDGERRKHPGRLSRASVYHPPVLRCMRAPGRSGPRGNTGGHDRTGVAPASTMHPLRKPRMLARDHLLGSWWVSSLLTADQKETPRHRCRGA